jgi:hypothetical protein
MQRLEQNDETGTCTNQYEDQHLHQQHKLNNTSYTLPAVASNTLTSWIIAMWRLWSALLLSCTSSSSALETTMPLHTSALPDSIWSLECQALEREGLAYNCADAVREGTGVEGHGGFKGRGPAGPGIHVSASRSATKLRNKTKQDSRTYSIGLTALHASCNWQGV